MFERGRSNERQMHICDNCDGHLVQPTDWEHLGDAGIASWEVFTRCPDCEHEKVDVYTAREVDAFDEVLNQAARTIEHNLKQTADANMREFAFVFPQALSQDLITAEDFRQGY